MSNLINSNESSAFLLLFSYREHIYVTACFWESSLSQCWLNFRFSVGIRLPLDLQLGIECVWKGSLGAACVCVCVCAVTLLVKTSKGGVHSLRRYSWGVSCLWVFLHEPNLLCYQAHPIDPWTSTHAEAEKPEHNIKQHVTNWNNMQQPATTCNKVQQGAIMCNNMQRCTTTC